MTCRAVLAVGKLVLVDLAHLDPIGRIGLFLGFGAARRAVSDVLPSLWRPVPGATGGQENT